MKRGLSIALAVAAALNLWALAAGPLAQEPAPAPQQTAPAPQQPPPAAPQPPPAPQPEQPVADPRAPEGGRAKAATATGDAPQHKAHGRRSHQVKAAAASSVTIKDFSF